MWLLGVGGRVKDHFKNEEESREDVHRKRVSQILRYISTTQSNGISSYSFVRPLAEEVEPHHHEPFFKKPQRRDGDDDESDVLGRVPFSTYDFQQVAFMLSEVNVTTTPFSFYMSHTSNNAKSVRVASRKRTAGGGTKQPSGNSSSAATSPRLESCAQGSAAGKGNFLFLRGRTETHVDA
jgi:hypothetical protein